MSPRFSIIIPVCNNAPQLRECLDSVLKQDFCDWEAVCINDGSTDGTGETLDEYAARDSRFKVYHKTNGGVSSARNLALRKATAPWIMFVDADDSVETGCLSSIMSVVEQNQDVEVIAWGDYSGAKLYEGLWNKAYHRSVVPLHGFRPYAHGEDRLFILEALAKASRIITIDKKLYNYKPTSCSVTRRKRDRQWILDTIGYSGEMIEILPRLRVDAAIGRRLYHDIAVWVLEECSYVECGVAEWKAFLPNMIECEGFSPWHRFVARKCFSHGVFVQWVLCYLPRVLKRLYVRCTVFGRASP